MSWPVSLLELLSELLLVRLVLRLWLLCCSTAVVLLLSVLDSEKLPDRLLLVADCVPLDVAVSLSVVRRVNGVPLNCPPDSVLDSCTWLLAAVVVLSLLEPVISLIDSEPLFVS